MLQKIQVHHRRREDNKKNVGSTKYKTISSTSKCKEQEKSGAIKKVGKQQWIDPADMYSVWNV